MNATTIRDDAVEMASFLLMLDRRHSVSLPEDIAVAARRTNATAYALFHRGLITYEELLLQPDWADDPLNTAEFHADVERQLAETAERNAWRCIVCGNQNRDGAIGSLCGYHARYRDDGSPR